MSASSSVSQYRTSSHPRHAFTLVELLAVVAIILLLAALLMPTLAAFKRRGQDTKCLANMKQWASYWNLFVSDNGGNFMDGYVNDSGYVGFHRGAWLHELRTYYAGQMDLLRCPLAMDTNVVAGSVVDYGGVNTTFRHGVQLGAGYDRGSYGLNVWLYNPPLGKVTSELENREPEKHWRGYGAIKAPTRVPMFHDSMWRGAGPDNDNCEAPASNGEWTGYNSEMRHVAMDRHKGGVEMAFVNGAARHVGIKENWVFLWNKTWDPISIYKTSWPGWMASYQEYKPQPINN